MLSEAQEKKIKDSKDILQLAAKMSELYYQKPLIITYSGGKDSDVMLQLAIECLEPSQFEVMNSHTSVDAPETVYYIRDKFKQLAEMGIKATVNIPRYKDGTQKTMWNLIVKKQLPPTRLQRYCCAELKETNTPNRFVATGVRAAESTNRQGRSSFSVRVRKKSDAQFWDFEHIRDVFESSEKERERLGANPNDEDVYDCKFIENAKKKADLICNPVYEWLDSDIWDFIHDRKMSYNPLYDCGFKRVGCIGCPMSTRKAQELERYPKFKQAYKNAFKRMCEAREKAGKVNKKHWGDADRVYAWWIEDKQIPGQMMLDGTEYKP